MIHVTVIAWDVLARGADEFVMMIPVTVIRSDGSALVADVLVIMIPVTVIRWEARLGGLMYCLL